MSIESVEILPPHYAETVADAAEPAAALLRLMGHAGRLQILCHLSGGERTVSELQALLNEGQPSVSRMLSELRAGGLVAARRVGRIHFYRLVDTRPEQVISMLHTIYSEAA